MKFTAEIKIIGVNPYVLVTIEQAQKLKKGWKKPMPVQVQINGQPTTPWKINMMPVGDGTYYLYLHGDVRKASQTVVGDTVEVSVVFDEVYKSGPLPLPDWLQKVLDTHPKEKNNWHQLIPSRQKEIVRYLLSLKSDEAKAKNLDKVMHILSGKPLRFMGRTWKDGQ